MAGFQRLETINPVISEAVTNILHSSDLTSLSQFVGENNGKRAKEDRVKRPMNAFMLYAQVARRKVATKYPNLNYAKLSKTLGKIWQVLPEEERRPFIQEAQRLRAQHKLKHPDYKYTPKRNKEKSSRSGVAFRKAQYETLKPDELFNILSAIPLSAPATRLPTSDNNKTAYNAFLDSPLNGEPWAIDTYTNFNMPRNPSKTFQPIDYMELPSFTPGLPSRTDFQWPDPFPVSNYANHLLDTNLFLPVQKQVSIPSESLLPSLTTCTAAVNQSGNGLEFPQWDPMKQKNFENGVENLSSLFEGKPSNMANCMVI